jgi:hypothetical protein
MILLVCGERTEEVMLHFVYRKFWVLPPGGVFAVEMEVFFGNILEVIAKHFIFENSIY